EALLLTNNCLDAICDSAKLTVIAGTGKFRDLTSQKIPKDIEKLLIEAMEQKSCLYGEDYFVGYFPSRSGPVNLFFIDSMATLSDDDKRLIDLFALNVGIAFDNLLINKELEQSQSEIIIHLSDLIERRDPNATGHIRRVAEMSYQLAKIIGMPEFEANLLKHAAPLHDIGKLLIDEQLLTKKGGLDDSQWHSMQQHAQLGSDILGFSDKPMVKLAAILASQHHEKYDGSGYPQGLVGEDISIHARIMALADVFDSLTHDSSYKVAWPRDEAIKYIRANSGKHFDPLLVSALIENIHIITHNT
ncbi:MAG: HD-GYP domain-containing protein, partial [Shewanella sp.]